MVETNITVTQIIANPVKPNTPSILKIYHPLSISIDLISIE